MNLGRLIFDEIVCDITRIWLEDGQWWVQATTAQPGDYSFDNDADINIFAPDGTQVYHLPSVARGNHRNHTLNGYLTVTVPFVHQCSARRDLDGNLHTFPIRT